MVSPSPTNGSTSQSVSLSWSKPAGLWCLPVETVSQSEGGFERVYQSSAVIPHWIVSADASRKLGGSDLLVGRAGGENGSAPAKKRLGLVEVATGD